ncbi:hypothetical protein ACH40F_33670 [Streptomyces sp. NPDC020794]|uniref:hypothetical protein n=1 Tax=unclassified Streptomyces TaxID=2593676 RepID=UPI0036E4D0D8
MHLLRRLGPPHDLPDTPEGNLRARTTCPPRSTVSTASEDLHVFAVRYGSPGPFAPVFEHGPAGLTIRTEAFTALIGSPAGDA